MLSEKTKTNKLSIVNAILNNTSVPISNLCIKTS